MATKNNKKNTKKLSIKNAVHNIRKKISSNKKKNNAKKGDNAETSKLQVINGTRRRNKIIKIVVFSVIFVIIIALIVAHILLPTGLVEAVQNGYAALGSGELPVTFYAANPTEYLKYGNISCILNKTYFEVYNENGKLIQAASHGLSNPKLEVSAARFLVYDFDRYGLKIFNYSTELYSTEYKNTIISADIARNGTYAVVTTSDSYRGTVSVYNKDNELLYTWNSANNYITDVTVAENGKSIALTLLNAKNGAYVSSVCVFNFDNPSPVAKYENNGLVSSVRTVNKNYFVAHGLNNAYMIPWSDGAPVDLGIVGNIRNIEITKDGMMSIVYGRGDNETINTVLVLNDEGSKVASVPFNSKVTDCTVTEENIMVLSNEKIFMYDFSGNLLATTVCDIKPLFISACDNDTVITVDSSKMKAVNLISGE